MKARIIHGDVFDGIAQLDDDSIDSCVTDPPYGIGFMGKEWDTFKPDTVGALRTRTVKNHKAAANPNLKGRMQWSGGAAVEYDYSPKGLHGFQSWTQEWARAVFRVLKPGAHLLVSAAPRSYHRMACGVGDAGFEVRDAIVWMFGQGFPKSKNLKGDKEGWGTALKPAWEPILMARKPFDGTVAENVAQHGTAALNIDGCRVEVDADDLNHRHTKPSESGDKSMFGIGGVNYGQNPSGRWPANVIHDGSEEVIELFPSEAGAFAQATRRNSDKFRNAYGAFAGTDECGREPDDRASAARFFYCAKASRADRDDGMSGFEKKPLHWSSGDKSPGTFQSPNTDRSARNHHPTVKPTDLMRYLCALVTPPGGVVLDPFMGSGSTGRGALLGGFQFIGIEREAEYVEIAEQRIKATAPLFADVTT